MRCRAVDNFAVMAKNGKAKPGRKRSLDYDRIHRLLKSGSRLSDIAAEIGSSRQAVRYAARVIGYRTLVSIEKIG